MAPAARPNAGDDSNPRSGEGGPRHTPAALAADPAFTGTYAQVFAVASPTGVAATDYANIVVKANAASTAGGGVVALKTGTYNLGGLGPLPMPSGVVYQGVEPTITEQVLTNGTWLADGEWNYTGGTILTGDGTTACFEANPTDQGVLPTNVGNTVITNAGVIGVGLDGFTYGIHVGAVNIMGLAYSRIDKVYIKNCSQWAVKLVNFAHCDIGAIYSVLCQNGHYYGALMPAATFIPGNTVVRDLYNLVPRDGRDNRLCRGIVFEAGGTSASLNELNVGRVQNNGFNRTLLSVTAGITSASTSVTVPDGTKFAVGMPVNFTTTANGYTLGQLYFVLSVSGNTLTLGASRTGSAISGTGTANMTLQTYGFPNVELSSLNTGARVNNSTFRQIDSEGVATCGVYVENATAINLTLSDVPGTALVHVASRGMTYSRVESVNAIITDFDAVSTSSAFYGTRTSAYQRALRGQWLDNSTSTYVTAVGPGSQGAGIGGDLQVRINGFLYPPNGLGERIFPRDTNITLSGTNAGTLVFNGGTGITFTLPTIVTDTTPSASHIGMVFDVVNVSANSLTVATDGTQLFNNVAAKTSLTVATQTGLRITASKTNGGTLFWTARPYALA